MGAPAYKPNPLDATYREYYTNKNVHELAQIRMQLEQMGLDKKYDLHDDRQMLRAVWDAQKMLGVKQDYKWGPRTQAAYDRQHGVPRETLDAYSRMTRIQRDALFANLGRVGLKGTYDFTSGGSETIARAVYEAQQILGITRPNYLWDGATQRAFEKAHPELFEARKAVPIRQMDLATYKFPEKVAPEQKAPYQLTFRVHIGDTDYFLVQSSMKTYGAMKKSDEIRLFATAARSDGAVVHEGSPDGRVVKYEEWKKVVATIPADPVDRTRRVAITYIHPDDEKYSRIRVPRRSTE